MQRVLAPKLSTRSSITPAAFKPCSCSKALSRKLANPRSRNGYRLQASTDSDVDLEAQVEEFLKRQAEIESGAAFARTKELDTVVGKEVVPDEAAKQYCRDILEVLKTLKATRDMSITEVKLIVSIEDPRAKERRAMGIENSSGVSRDEMAAALMEVVEGRIPKDRVALKVLRDEITDWPYLVAGASDGGSQKTATTSESASQYARMTGGDSIARPYILGKDAPGREGEKPQSVTDLLPDWFGYIALYGISAIPVFLAVGAVLILFWNALQ